MTRHAEEDYIKFIYEHGINHGPVVKVKRIAKHFNYTEQSVYEMVKKLHDQALVTYEPYKGVKLSDAGRKEAIRMIRSHRIWEVFLKEYLNYSWEDVHDEAEQLEHAGSDTLLKKLYEKLGSPKTCQHGNPIPDFDGLVKHIDMMSLKDAKQGSTFEIQKVLDHSELLTYLSSISVTLNDKIKIINKQPFHEVIEIEVHGNRKTISLKTASMLYGKML